MEVRFKNVSFSYGDNCIFDNFSCLIKSNLISGIIGSSGCGKSTLLNLIDGLDKCSVGYISVGDYEVSDGIRKSIGYLFQFSEDQFFNSSVYMEIEFGLKCFESDNIDSRIRNAINLVGLDDSFLSLNPYKLSNGEKRKVALASILAYDPDIIILDEPTIGLDNLSKKSLMRLLKDLKNKYGKTIIIVSHDLNFIHKFVDYVYLIKDGKVFLEGNKYDVLSNESAMKECGLIVPDILHFSNLVYEKKGIKIGYRDHINDLIKDVYRYAKW
jgi:energy-coupling factor transport system ATP-binding protein